MDKTHLSRMATMARHRSLPDLQMAAIAEFEGRPRQYKLYKHVAKADPASRISSWDGNLFAMNKKTKSVPNLVHMSDLETENWMLQTSNIFPYINYYPHLKPPVVVPRQGRYQKKKSKKVFSRYDSRKLSGQFGFHSNPLSSLAKFSKSETNLHQNLIRYAKYSKSPIKQ